MSTAFHNASSSFTMAALLFSLLFQLFPAHLWRESVMSNVTLQIQTTGLSVGMGSVGVNVNFGGKMVL